MLAFYCRTYRVRPDWVDGWMSDIPLISDILLSLHSLVVRYPAGIGQPTPQVLAAMRPNPMDPDLAVPAFVRTLISMKKTLAEPETWSILRRHLTAARLAKGS